MRRHRSIAWIVALFVPFAPFVAGAQGAPGAVGLASTDTPAASVYVRCANEAEWHHSSLPAAAVAKFDAAAWSASCAQYAVLAQVGGAVAAAVVLAGGLYDLSYDAKRGTARIGRRPVAVLQNDARGSVVYSFTCPGRAATSGSVGSGTHVVALGCANGSLAIPSASGEATFAFGDGRIARITSDALGNVQLTPLELPPAARIDKVAVSADRLPAALQPYAAQFIRP